MNICGHSRALLGPAMAVNKNVCVEVKFFRPCVPYYAPLEPLPGIENATRGLFLYDATYAVFLGLVWPYRIQSKRCAEKSYLCLKNSSQKC